MKSNGYQLIYRFRLYADKLHTRDQLLRSIRSIEEDLLQPHSTYVEQTYESAKTALLMKLGKIMDAMDADRVILEALKGDYLRSGRTHEELEVLLCGIHGPERLDP